MASKTNFFNSKKNSLKMTWMRKKIKTFKIHYNYNSTFWTKKKLILWKSQIFNLQSILKGIFKFWLQILLKNISLYTNWFNYMDMISDMIYGSYLTIIIWVSSLNYSFKLYFIIHLYNFRNLDNYLVLIGLNKLLSILEIYWRSLITFLLKRKTRKMQVGTCFQ